MRAVIFENQDGVFKFDQKEVNEIIRCNRSKYDLDQVANLQDLISTECNETYLSGHLIPIKVGSGRSPLDIQREKKSVFSCLFNKRRKPPEMSGGIGYECSEGHNLLSVIIWKTF